ncbi:hypothetical protein ACSYAD_21670 [Acaryochloris marina NIES-2412]|uniref:hypothetical protein n=1 Tax=Acaryochloris marina TaxID=155978 RepID=UPI0040585FD7
MASATSNSALFSWTDSLSQGPSGLGGTEVSLWPPVRGGTGRTKGCTSWVSRLVDDADGVLPRWRGRILEGRRVGRLIGGQSF